MGQVKSKITRSEFYELGQKLHNGLDIYFDDREVMQICKYELDEHGNTVDAILCCEWYSENDIRILDGYADIELSIEELEIFILEAD